MYKRLTGSIDSWLYQGQKGSSTFPKPYLQNPYFHTLKPYGIQLVQLPFKENVFLFDYADDLINTQHALGLITAKCNISRSTQLNEMQFTFLVYLLTIILGIPLE